ncbi:hypothetical protein F511_41866 [Dorcoceras hygrometricum]|uniref:Dystroglycan-like n=1 Tax=Dorcoceras hygrometricum TaxID=472368 RepID=A0A2Z7C172_9LAMI|nr:hypothetical protein F511_41866 [Dorcoceras hygrometricum]
MASSLFVNTVHVCFESVLAMDNSGMVAMFESLVATRLKGFLGCPAVIHEAALLEFFENGSVRDGLVVSTVNGVTVEISEQLFAETFELTVEGLTYLLEIPKDLVFDARSIVSLSGEPVSISGKKKEMTIEFRLLCDILAKTIPVKAGSFDAITQEKFLMMAAITCGVRINWNRLLFKIFKDMVTAGMRQSKGQRVAGETVVEQEPAVEVPGEEVIECIVEPYSEPAVEDVANSGMSTADDVDTIIEQVLAETAQIGPDKEEQDVGGLDVGEQAAPKADEFEQWLNLSYEEFHARQAGQPVVTASDTDEDLDTMEEMETEDVELSADEAMSLEDILLTIPVVCPLPSANVEITKITLGQKFSIPGVHEGDWYKAGLPKIPATDKGKAPLQDRDLVNGNPIKEQFSLILADIEVLVQLREQIIDDVDRFFNSFSLKKLANFKIDESYFDKEALILSWAATDSTRVALNRRMYILTKYRELLIRKFLEAMKINFIPGEGSSATDLKALEMLSDLHMFVVEDLKEQTMAHAFVRYSLFSGLRTDDIRSFVSSIALDRTVLRDVQRVQSSVFVSPQVQSISSPVVEGPSVQMMLNQIPFSSSTSDDSSMHFDYNDTADTSISQPPAATDVIESLAKLRASLDQVRCEQFRRKDDAHNLKDILLVHLRDLEKRISARFDEQDRVHRVLHKDTHDQKNLLSLDLLSVTSWRLSQLCTAFVRYSLFSGLRTDDIRSFVSSIALDRTVLRDVQRVQSSVFVSPQVQSISSPVVEGPSVQMMLNQIPFSSSTSDDSSMHFDYNDTADTSISQPPAATDVIESLAKLRASLDQVRCEQFRRKDDAHNLKDILLVHLQDLEKRISARFDEQDRVHRVLHKDTHDQKNLLSLDLKSTHQKLSAQIAAAAFDTVDVRKEVKEINTKVTYLDGQVAEIRSEQLEFCAKIEENYLNLSTQLGLIVDYLRSGDARGKVVAATSNHLLTIKVDPAGEVVAMAIKLEVVLGKVVAEVEVREGAIGVDRPREDFTVVVVDRSEDHLKIG